MSNFEQGYTQFRHFWPLVKMLHFEGRPTFLLSIYLGKRSEKKLHREIYWWVQFFEKCAFKMPKFDISQRYFFEVFTKHVTFKTLSLRIQFFKFFPTFQCFFDDIYEIRKIGERAYLTVEMVHIFWNCVFRGKHAFFYLRYSNVELVASSNTISGNALSANRMVHHTLEENYYEFDYNVDLIHTPTHAIWKTPKNVSLIKL